MAWLYLIIAGLFEIGWPLGIKYAYDAETKAFQFVPAVLAVASMALSGGFLYLATAGDGIPMGTAYAVWTGIGSVGAFVAGILLFKEPATAARMACVGLIVAGIVGLKLFGEH